MNSPEPEHYYGGDDRCKCGAVVVYFESRKEPGYGCDAEGKPWDESVRDKDPMARIQRYMP